MNIMKFYKKIVIKGWWCIYKIVRGYKDVDEKSRYGFGNIIGVVEFNLYILEFYMC